MTGLYKTHVGNTKKIISLLFGCLFLLSILLMGTACTRSVVDIKPVEIKPIHITIDINLKVDKALDDYFDDIDNMQTKSQPSAKRQNSKQ